MASDSEPFEASFDHFPLPPFGAEVQTSPRSPAALSQFPGSCGLASQQPAVVFLPNIASPARQRLTAEVSVQTGRQLPDEVTPQRAPGVSIAVQAGRTPLLSDSSMQATECRDTVDSATQVKPALQDASSQARGECTEFASQTEAAPTVETSSQAGSEFLPSSVETQTAEAQCVHAGVQAEWEAPAVEAVKAVAATAEFGMQTTPAMLKSATSQTQAAERTNMATQVILPQMVHMSVQAKDEVAASQAAAREGQLKELQSRLQASQAAEVETTRLIAESTQLSEELGRCKDQSQAWMQMAQTKALGQMNITILCPRAECTVNGQRVEMDSWNPDKIRAEFEEQVLPRFSKIFVDEGAAAAGQAKPEAVQATMQEFASVFRERLAAMLSAPNAAANARGAKAVSQP